MRKKNINIYDYKYRYLEIFKITKILFYNVNKSSILYFCIFDEILKNMGLIFLSITIISIIFQAFFNYIN